MGPMVHDADGEATTRDLRTAKNGGLLPSHVFRDLRFLRFIPFPPFEFAEIPRRSITDRLRAAVIDQSAGSVPGEMPVFRELLSDLSDTAEDTL